MKTGKWCLDPQEEIVVEVDEAELAFRGLTPRQVALAIHESDAKTASGTMRSSAHDLLMEVDSELESVQRVAEIPLKASAENVVRLGDVAEVKKQIQTPRESAVSAHGKPAVALGALVLSSQRVDVWNAEASQVVDEFERDLPRGLELIRVFEQSQYVEQRLANLGLNLLIGAAAVVGVILVIMGWRNALIVGAALPLTAFMVLGGLRLLEIPIHQMSVSGLIIALGLLIDSAIVMVDEVRERLLHGESPRDVVARSVRHLAVPLLGSTLTTAFAFAPIAIMPGGAGEFVGSIAVSVILAIFSSLFLAMTVTPTLAAIWNASLGGKNSERWWNRGIESQTLSAWNLKFLSAVVRRPAVAIAIVTTLSMVGFWQAAYLPNQFFPPADRDQIHIEVELPAFASLEATQRTTAAMAEIIEQDASVTDITWFHGETAPSFYYNIVKRREKTANYAHGIVNLTSAENGRPLIHRLQAELDREFPQARTLVRQLEQGPPFDAPVEVRVFGPDIDRLQEIGQQVRAELANIDKVTHIRTDLSDVQPKLAIQVDEVEARLLGLSNAAIAGQLNSSVDGATGGSILEETEDLPVRVRISDSRRGSLAALRSLDLRADAATHESATPLAAIGEVTVAAESSNITRLNSRRMNEAQAFIEAGVLPDEVLSEFKAKLAAGKIAVPDGYSIEFGGEASKRSDAVGNLMSSVGILMVMMIATLVISFNSFRMASVIGVVGVFSIGFGLLAIGVFGYPFGFMAIVGTMGLVGVAINDAIVVLAAIRGNPAAREGNRAAIVDVVASATRHVIATTLTTIVGFLPLVLSGGGFWPPLAAAIAGGVGGATMLALVFVPASYALMHRVPEQAIADTRERSGEAAPAIEKQLPCLAAMVSGSST